MLGVYIFSAVAIILIMAYFIKIDEIDIGYFFSAMIVLVVVMLTVVAASSAPNQSTINSFSNRRIELTIMREGVSNTNELFLVNNLILEYNNDLEHEQRFDPNGFWNIFINDGIYDLEFLEIDTTLHVSYCRLVDNNTCS